MKETLITQLALKYFFLLSIILHINTNSSFLINNIIQETKVTAEYFRNLIVISREVLLVIIYFNNIICHLSICNFYFFDFFISSIFGFLYFFFSKFLI